MEQTLHINFAKFKSYDSMSEYFCTEEICKAAIAQERWGDGTAVCPYCGSTHTHLCSDKYTVINKKMSNHIYKDT
jgi:hypothetical protein